MPDRKLTKDECVGRRCYFPIRSVGIYNGTAAGDRDVAWEGKVIGPVIYKGKAMYFPVRAFDNGVTYELSMDTVRGGIARYEEREGNGGRPSVELLEQEAERANEAAAAAVAAVVAAKEQAKAAEAAATEMRAKARAAQELAAASRPPELVESGSVLIGRIGIFYPKTAGKRKNKGFRYGRVKKVETRVGAENNSRVATVEVLHVPTLVPNGADDFVVAASSAQKAVNNFEQIHGRDSGRDEAAAAAPSDPDDQPPRMSPEAAAGLAEQRKANEHRKAIRNALEHLVDVWKS